MRQIDDDHREGKTTTEIEKQTSKLPSVLFLSAAIASMGLSLTFKLMNRGKTALFVGQWTAPFLILGLYNKIVKVEGHDKSDQYPD